MVTLHTRLHTGIGLEPHRAYLLGFPAEFPFLLRQWSISSPLIFPLPYLHLSLSPFPPSPFSLSTAHSFSNREAQLKTFGLSFLIQQLETIALPNPDLFSTPASWFLLWRISLMLRRHRVVRAGDKRSASLCPVV